MDKFKNYLLTLFCVTVGLCHSQNEQKKWYFGYQAALDFMTNPPTSLTNCAMSGGEGCTSVADATGSIIFYTDGVTVFNKQHVAMANGTGMQGDLSSSQSALAVKHPGIPDLYYLFTQGFTVTGLGYSIINTTLAAGLGSVTVKNTTLVPAANCTEKLIAVKHCNGVDSWILTHDFNSSDFRAYLLTSAGLNTVPVISSAGSIHYNPYGCMKASPYGSKLGLAISSTSLINGAFELFDFNNSTGQVSNPLYLGSNFGWTYGCEFSPDGKLFYGTDPTTGVMRQWDVCAGAGTAIIASQATVGTFPNSSLCSMQLGPNGKIYVARLTNTDLGVINNPNVVGPGCNYVDAGQSIAPNFCFIGLPNLQAGFYRKPSSFGHVLNCATSLFSLPQFCSVTTPSPTAFAWNFGDALSASNTSTLTNPSHTYPGPGNYSVQLVVSYACGTDTIRDILPVVNVPSLTIFGDYSVCAGSKLELSATGADNYLWSYPGGSDTGMVLSHFPTTSGAYTLTGFISNGGCFTKKTFGIYVANCTGIFKNSSNHFKLYPNPATSEVHVETTEATTISIFNELGELMLMATLPKGRQKLDLSHFSKGIYIVRATGPNTSFAEKLILLNSE